MNIELSTGLPEAWQWDTNLKLKISDEIPEAHFRFDGKAGTVDVEDGWVEIPNELLQKTDDIEVWTYDSEHTMDFGRITVRGRPKPDTYVYTPTEVKRWEDLDERIKALEENNSAVLYTEQELTDEQKAQARENIGIEFATSDDSLELLTETGIITPAYQNGTIYTAPTGEIYVI